MNELEGKVAVITGAASGIGLAIAERAARAGMNIVAADLNEAMLDETVAGLQKLGVEALAVRVDVSYEPSVEALAKAAFARFSAVHLLVNNAGIAYAESAWNTPAEQYERVIGINLFGVIHAVRAFVPHMIETKEPGHIVNVASAAGLFTVPGFAAYCASKFGVVGFSEALKHDLTARKLPISVSVLCPSWVKTRIADMHGEQGADELTKLFNKKVEEAVAHGMDPEIVAQRVLEAVQNDTFYVLTHEDTKAAVRARASDILDARPPSWFLR